MIMHRETKIYGFKGILVPLLFWLLTLSFCHRITCWLKLFCCRYYAPPKQIPPCLMPNIYKKTFYQSTSFKFLPTWQTLIVLIFLVALKMFQLFSLNNYIQHHYFLSLYYKNIHCVCMLVYHNLQRRNQLFKAEKKYIYIPLKKTKPRSH